MEGVFLRGAFLKGPEGAFFRGGVLKVGRKYRRTDIPVSTEVRDHPFKTSPFFRGRGVKNWPNLPTDSSKKLPTVGG